MSWHCLQEPAEEFSVESYLDGIASERWRLSDTRAKSCSPDSGTASSTASRSGMTCGHLTGNPGEGLSMLSAEDSRARTFPRQAREQGLTAREADFGQKCTESYARYDLDSHTWKTPQCSFLAGLDEFSETWPKSGIMRFGRAYPRQIAEPRTSARGYGYLQCRHMIPTPTCCNAPNAGSNTKGPKSLLTVAQTEWLPGEKWITPMAKDGDRSNLKLESLRRHWKKHPGSNLAEQVAMRETFPTPTSFDGGHHLQPGTFKRNSPPLSAVVMFPTPQVADNKFAYNAKRENIEARKGKHQMCLAHAVQQEELEKDPKATHGGALNPTWVEWLMGWPLGWTDLKQLGTDKYRLWLRQHSEFCTGS